MKIRSRRGVEHDEALPKLCNADGKTDVYATNTAGNKIKIILIIVTGKVHFLRIKPWKTWLKRAFALFLKVIPGRM